MIKTRETVTYSACCFLMFLCFSLKSSHAVKTFPLVNHCLPPPPTSPPCSSPECMIRGKQKPPRFVMSHCGTYKLTCKRHACEKWCVALHSASKSSSAMEQKHATASFYMLEFVQCCFFFFFFFISIKFKSEHPLHTTVRCMLWFSCKDTTALFARLLTVMKNMHQWFSEFFFKKKKKSTQ